MLRDSSKCSSCASRRSPVIIHLSVTDWPRCMAEVGSALNVIIVGGAGGGGTEIGVDLGPQATRATKSASIQIMGRKGFRDMRFPKSALTNAAAQAFVQYQKPNA